MSSSVDPETVGESAHPSGDGGSVDGSFRTLWESAQRAADLIAGLRQERQSLKAHVARLEQELQQVRSEAAHLKKMAGDHSKEGGPVIAGGERDLLAARVRELIAKLDAYL